MAQFFKAKKPSRQHRVLRKQTAGPLDHHLKAVIKHEGQVYFVPGLLPGELADIKVQGGAQQAELHQLHQRAESRIEPTCPYFERCGGCAAQHMSQAVQTQAKQLAVAHLMTKLAGIEQLPEAESLLAEAWHYRRVTRLSTWFAGPKGWLLGYRQRASKQLVAIEHCPLLVEPLSKVIAPLQSLLATWPKKLGLGHVDLVAVDSDSYLRLRCKTELPSKHLAELQSLCEEAGFSLSVRSDAGEQVQAQTALYELTNQQLSLEFSIGDFIQVNSALNQEMVDKALAWLELNNTDRVLDLYAGIGNFSLAIAQQVDSVLAVEGVKRMAQRIQSNAKRNGFTNVQAFAGDLEQPETWQQFSDASVNKVLLDPARSGAKQAIAQVAKLAPETVVYVSCNPATLARDAATLIQAGYLLKQWAVVDMFTHTEHIETIAQFQRIN